MPASVRAYIGTAISFSMRATSGWRTLKTSRGQKQHLRHQQMEPAYLSFRGLEKKKKGFVWNGAQAAGCCCEAAAPTASSGCCRCHMHYPSKHAHTFVPTAGSQLYRATMKRTYYYIFRADDFNLTDSGCSFLDSGHRTAAVCSRLTQPPCIELGFMQQEEQK